jgi:hypothetical protein
MADETNLRALKPTVDDAAVKALEEWLEQAKRGEIIGVVMFGSRPGDGTIHRWAGELQFSRALLCFEQWKINHLLEQTQEVVEGR